MNDAKVKPALTPEQWAKLDTDAVFFKDGVPHIWPVYLPTPVENPGGVAALLLSVAGPDGKPLFTRDDAAAIHSLLRMACACGVITAEDGRNWNQSCDLVKEVAGRLESLLPPEGE
jgi:hypothetical protein